MVLSVTPIRTVSDFTTLEYFSATVTSGIGQTVETYIDTTLADSRPLTANTPERIDFFTVKTAGVYDLKIKGVTAGEWRGKVAYTAKDFIGEFQDEAGTAIEVHNVFLNLDSPILLNPKRTKTYQIYKYTQPGRWIQEAYRREPDGTFRYTILDMATITPGTNIRLPKITEAMVRVSLDLGVVWPYIINGAKAIDIVVGTVLSALGFKDYPSLATYMIEYQFNLLPMPPTAWKLEGNILHIYYRVTRDMVGIAPLIIGLIVILAKIAGAVIGLYFFSVIVTEISEAVTARSDAQTAIAGETTSAIDAWLKYAEEHGLTPEETQRGLETVTSAYKQMSQNVEPYPIPWGTLLTVIGLLGGGAILVYLLRGFFR